MLAMSLIERAVGVTKHYFHQMYTRLKSRHSRNSHRSDATGEETFDNCRNRNECLLNSLIHQRCFHMLLENCI